jgi:ferric-dicitrate binding protein FerR (iron transport regulator)
MSKHQPHNDEHSRFFEKTQIPYSRSKEDVWNDMMAKMKDQQEDKPEPKTRSLVFYWVAAAVVALLIGITIFMRFYSMALHAPPGQHLSKKLPDGSQVHLNAGTELTYHPYWWKYARILELEGEAYFEVEKGNRFTVKSANGTTQVLGTRFNIYTRNNKYRVHCLSGKVQVETNAGGKKILSSNQAISVSNKGEMKYQSGVKSKHAIAWTKNQFVYTAAPLKEVLKEMERQFDITIETDQGIEGEYTGNFQRGSSPETILEMIARPFGLEVEQIHQTKYRITKSKD